jgi:hypothetical protein
MGFRYRDISAAYLGGIAWRKISILLTSAKAVIMHHRGLKARGSVRIPLCNTIITPLVYYPYT